MSDFQSGDKLTLVRYKDTDELGYFGKELRRLAELPYVTFDHYGNDGRDKDIVYVKESKEGIFTNRFVLHEPAETSFKVGDKVLLVDGVGWFSPEISYEHLINRTLTVIEVTEGIVTVEAPEGVLIHESRTAGGFPRRFAKID